MPLTKSPTKAAFSKNVAAERNAGKRPDVALAIAYKVQREAKRAAGGATPFYVRSAAHNLERSGFIHSPVAGRTDRISMGVKPGSYVMPADVLSGVGQGNSLAGAHAFNRLLGMGPYGSNAPKIKMPSAGMMRGRKGFADGGSTPVDIVAAGGEYVIPVEKVAEVGGGDIDHGHAILDAMVKQIRKRTIKTLRKLPGPKQG